MSHISYLSYDLSFLPPPKTPNHMHTFARRPRCCRGDAAAPAPQSQSRGGARWHAPMHRGLHERSFLRNVK